MGALDRLGSMCPWIAVAWSTFPLLWANLRTPNPMSDALKQGAERGPRSDEQAAVDAIAAVVGVSAPPSFEPDGPSGADWRVHLNNGRTADVEVTTRPDGDMNSFFAALCEKDGSHKVWPDERLAHHWTVVVMDRSPGTNKARRRLKELVADLGSVLAQVEAAGGDPERLKANAQAALDGSTLIARTSDAITLLDFPRLQIDDGKHSQLLHVSIPPEWVGPKGGSIESVPFGGARGFSGYGDLVEAVRRCINIKTEKRQLDDAPCLRWLAIVLDGVAGWQLKHYFAGESRMSPPKLDGISFGYFDEVWAIRATQDDRRRSEDARIGPNYEPIFVVLRLSDGGETQRHYVVPQPAENPDATI